MLKMLGFVWQYAVEILVNVDFPGIDITSLYSPDASVSIFAHRTPPASSSPMKRPNTIKNTTSHTIATDPSLSQVYQNVDFPGADYRTLFPADYEECHRSCTQDSACQFFTFANGVFTPEKIRYKCHLKFSWTIPRMPQVEVKAGLVSAFSLKIQVSQYCDKECKRELLVNVGFPGTDITSLYSPDAEHCQQLCTQHSSCLFFSFIRPDWTRDNRHFFCYLKSTSSGKPKVLVPELGVTSGFSLKPCIPDPNPCLSQVYQNVDFPGADYRSLFTANYEECQRACTRDPACQFFTFANGVFTPERIRYKCHLKFSWTVPRIPIINPSAAIISGFSQRIQTTQYFNTPCEGKLFPGTDIPISSIEVLPAASPEHCQTLCSAHPLCTFFSYISHTFNCYLKNKPYEMVLKGVRGYTSGLPARFCQLDNNWIKKTHVNLDFPFSDIRFFLTNDVEMCQRTCTEDPNCQFYSYITVNFHISSYRRRCYLKRVITMPTPPKVTKLANVVSGFSMKNCYYKGIV